MVEAIAYQHADRRQFSSSDNSPLGTGGAGVLIDRSRPDSATPYFTLDTSVFKK